MATAFSKTVSCKLTFDATTGLPTGVTGAVEESLVSGIIKGVTSKLSGDEVVKGMGATAADVLVAYGSAQFAQRAHTGRFKLNPFSAA